MKFIPPDEPTAVYPIKSLKKDDTTDDTPAPVAGQVRSPASKATPAHVPPDLGEVAGEGRRSRASTPRGLGARTPPPSARNPLLLVGALAFGMLLAAALVGLLALGLLLVQ